MTLPRQHPAAPATRHTRKRGSRLWRLLNSPFGLWVLSSVVLTAIAGGYGKLELLRTQEIHDKEEVVKLTFAIDAHIQDFLLGLRGCNTYESYCQKFADNLQCPKSYKFLCFRDLTMNDMLESYKVLKDKYPKINDADVIQEKIMKAWAAIENLKELQAIPEPEKKACDAEIHSCLDPFAGNPHALLNPQA